jgi:hypothetical protein
MKITDAERYRRKAEECRNAAELAGNGLDKNDWLELAAEWLKLAEDAAAHDTRGDQAVR